MANGTTSWGTDTDNVPVITSQQSEKVARYDQNFATITTMNAAISRQRINAHWLDGILVKIATEPAGVARRFKRDATIANSHARTVVINGRTYDLTGDTNTVRLLSVPPSSGDHDNGDLGYMPSTQAVYSKSGGSWTLQFAAPSNSLTINPGRTDSWVASGGDNGAVNPASGDVEVTLNTGLGVFAAEYRLDDTGVLTVSSGSGVTFYRGGQVVPSVSVNGIGQSIYVVTGPSSNTFFVSATGASISGGSAYTFETVEDLNDFIEIERAAIAAGHPNFESGTRFVVLSEPATSYRFWTLSTVGTNEERAASSHARKFVLGSVESELVGESNTLHEYNLGTTAGPSMGIGSAGDVIYNAFNGTTYRKAVASWVSFSNKGPVYAPPALLGGAVPEVSQLFSEYMSDKGSVYSDHYAFGNGAVADAGAANKHLVTGANLATLFRPLQDYTEKVTINSELQLYTENWNAGSHVMAGDRLGLWAKLQDGETWNADIFHQPEATLPIGINVSVPWANLPTYVRDAAMNWRVGQLMALQYRGIYRIAEIIPGTSFRIVATAGSASSGNAFTGNSIVALPIYTGVTIAGTSGANLVFEAGALPTEIHVGFRVGKVTANNGMEQNGDVYVTAINHAAGTVTLNMSSPASLATGSTVVFYPKITSGQIWTQKGWNIANPDCFLALEFDYSMFDGLNPAAETRNVSNSFLFNNVNNPNPDVPWGAWPALWAYSKHNGVPSGHGSSEMDFVEIWVDSSKGMRSFNAGTIGPGSGSKLYRKSDGGYSPTGSGHVLIPGSVSGRHKLGVVYVKNPAVNKPCAYTYVDDVLIQIEEFTWAALNNQIQIGMNMAFGAINAGFAGNLQFPMRTTHFQRANMNLYNLRVWYRAGAA